MESPIVMINALGAEPNDVDATAVTALKCVPTVRLIGADEEIGYKMRSVFGGRVHFTSNSVEQPSTPVIVLQAGVCVSGKSFEQFDTVMNESGAQLGRILIDAERPLKGATWFSPELLTSNQLTPRDLATADLDFDQRHLAATPNARRWVRADDVGMALVDKIQTDPLTWAKEQRLPQLKKQLWNEQTRPRLATIKRKINLGIQRRRFHKKD